MPLLLLSLVEEKIKVNYFMKTGHSDFLASENNGCNGSNRIRRLTISR